MQIVSSGDNLHELSHHILGGKKSDKIMIIFSLSFAEFAQSAKG